MLFYFHLHYFLPVLYLICFKQHPPIVYSPAHTQSWAVCFLF
nr:MAG TPA: hypothetical protein [Bacteriophage sp.]